VVGPIEVLVVAFPNAGMVSTMGPLLDGIVASGQVRIIDAILVSRDPEGELVITDLDDSVIPAWTLISDDPRPLISAEDAMLAAEEIAGDEVSLTFVVEHLWPETIRRLVEDSGGVLQLHTRIDRETAATAASVGT
jgi:hypothetical protein